MSNQATMSSRELRALGNPFQGTAPSTLQQTTRSGRQRDPVVVAQQHARLEIRNMRARVQRATKRTRAVLKTRMSTRPFVLQQAFGGVWGVHKSIPFEDQRRYDYVEWVKSFAPQMTRKMRRELQTRVTYKIFSTADVY